MKNNSNTISHNPSRGVETNIETQKILYMFQSTNQSKGIRDHNSSKYIWPLRIIKRQEYYKTRKQKTKKLKSTKYPLERILTLTL